MYLYRYVFYTRPGGVVVLKTFVHKYIYTYTYVALNDRKKQPFLPFSSTLTETEAEKVPKKTDIYNIQLPGPSVHIYTLLALSLSPYNYILYYYMIYQGSPPPKVRRKYVLVHIVCSKYI